MTHYNSPTCECKPCVIIRQHKAIQACGAAGKEPNVIPQETESMVEPVSFVDRDPDDAPSCRICGKPVTATIAKGMTGVAHRSCLDRNPTYRCSDGSRWTSKSDADQWQSKLDLDQARRDALKSKWNSGFCHGFVTALVIVLIATVALLVVSA